MRCGIAEWHVIMRLIWIHCLLKYGRIQGKDSALFERISYKTIKTCCEDVATIDKSMSDLLGTEMKREWMVNQANKIGHTVKTSCKLVYKLDLNIVDFRIQMFI
eukprot:376611_1